MGGVGEAVVGFVELVIYAYQTSAVFNFVANVALLAGSAKLFAPKLPTEGRSLDLTRRVQTSSSPVETCKIIYGESRVGGSLVYRNVHGPNNRYLWMIIVVADHEVDDITTLWINDEPIDWYAEVGDGDTGLFGEVYNTRWINSDGKRLVTVYRRRGGHLNGPSQLASGIPEWTSDHDGVGHAYVAFRFEIDDSEGGNDPESSESNVWEKGTPTRLGATVRGKKVYDPRLDPRWPFGSPSGTHDLDNPATWEHSDNPALCLADYLTDTSLGFGESAARIDWESMADAADVCELGATVWNATATAPINQQRFTCDGVVDTGDTHAEIISNLLTPMYGQLLYSAGTYGVLAAQWVAPVHTWTDSDLRGTVQYTPALGRQRRYNTVSGTYADPARDYRQNEFAQQSDAGYSNTDGGETDLDVTLPFTDNEYRAQWLARIMLRMSRMQERVTLELSLTALHAKVGDRVSLQLESLNLLGFFRIVQWELTSHKTMLVVLTEDESSVYDMSDHTVLTPFERPPTLADVGATPAAPTNLDAEKVFRGVRLTWSNPATTFLKHIDVYMRTDDTTPTDVSDRIATTLSDRITVGDLASNVYYFWIAARGVNGKSSDLVGPVIQIPDSRLDTPDLVDEAVSITTYGVGADVWRRAGKQSAFSWVNAISIVLRTNTYENRELYVTADFECRYATSFPGENGNLFYRLAVVTDAGTTYYGDANQDVPVFLDSDEHKRQVIRAVVPPVGLNEEITIQLALSNDTEDVLGTTPPIEVASYRNPVVTVQEIVR